jgi:hypothetical protein
MADRTTRAAVCFSSTFLQPGFDAPEPVGDYRVDHDEESIERVVGVRRSTHQMAPIDPADLDAALERDHTKL